MSSAFQYLADLVREHGWTLLIGTTLLLSIFCLLVRYSRSLATKNLLASTAMLAVLGYLIVAVVPMPRFGIDLGGAQSPPAPSTDSAQISPSKLMFALLQPGDAQPSETDAVLAAAPTMPSRSERLAAMLPMPEPVATTPSTAVDTTFDAAPWLAGAFAIGAIAFAGHLLFGWIHLRRLLSKSRSAPTELTGLVELPARTSLRIVNARVQPFCCGLLRPTIVLPSKLARPSDETRFILLHERAHLTSGDTRARLLAAFLRPLLFWHPLYWWLQQKLRFTSELLADDAAAQGSVADYVRCMMTLSTHPDPATGGALVATIFRRRSELFRRLEMMLQRDEAISRPHSPMSRWTRAASTLLVIALCAGTFGVERAVAQSPAKQERVQTQVRELKAELDRLRREIIALRDSEKANQQPKLVFGRLDPETGNVVVDPAEAKPRRVNLFGNPVERPADPVARNRQEPEAVAAPSASSNRRMLYRVQKGDTFARIAQKHLGSARRASELQRCNPNVEPNRLRVGQQLMIPLPANRASSAPRANNSHDNRLPRARTQNPLVAGKARRQPAGLPGAVAAPLPSRRSNPGTRDSRPPRASGGNLPQRATAAPQPPVGPRPSQPGVEPPPPVGPNAPRARRSDRRFPTPPGPTAPRSRGDVPGPAGPSASGPSVAGPSRTGPSRSGPSTSAPTASGTRRRAPTTSRRTAPGRSPSGATVSAGSATAPAATGAGSRRRGPTTPGYSGIPNTTTTTTSGFASSPRASNNRRSAGSTSLSSLADLVTRCIELRGDVEIQEVNVRHARSKKDSEIAKIRLRTKRSQFKAIESMLKQELQAAEQAHAHSKKLHERGFVTAAEVQATESKIVLLSRALQ